MLTRGDITAAYRLFLGREPENEDVVQAAMNGHANIAQLRQSFLHSPEFAARIAPIILARRFPLDLDEGAELVEVECEAESLRELLTRVEQTWTRLGQEDPYWSVLTDEAFKLDNFPKNEGLFWSSGEYDVLRLCRWMQRNRVVRPAGATCLEYGCGTGRGTRWLAREFHSVIACDISEAHLRLARRSAAPNGADIRFVRIAQLATLDELPPFDILFSVLVLQHNPPPVIAYVLDRLLARLRPGGVAYFQVPTFQAGYRFSVKEYLAPGSGGGKEMEMHVLPQRNIFQIAARNGCEPVEIEPDNMAGSLDLISTTFLLRKLTG